MTNFLNKIFPFKKEEKKLESDNQTISESKKNSCLKENSYRETSSSSWSWPQKIAAALSRSSNELSEKINFALHKKKLDQNTLDSLRKILLQADLGTQTTQRIINTLSTNRYEKEITLSEIQSIMAREIEKILTPLEKSFEKKSEQKTHVILITGVNGTGKTTTIGKLAAQIKKEGHSVMLAAADTFRAAAVEQLNVWSQRTSCPIIVPEKTGADPAGLSYTALQEAHKKNCDVLIIDTAGRLQNKTELMAELTKIKRVLKKIDPEAPHTVLQIIDATTGRNALDQVEIFKDTIGVNGLIVTKLDGTARGGILIAIAEKYQIPIYFIGTGEQLDDFHPFSAEDFAKTISRIDEKNT